MQGRTDGLFRGTERFALKKRLGAGGMGVVYSALDREVGDLVALKTIRNLDGPSLRSLKSEFRSLTDVAHPNLVALHELVFDADHWFFTMELVDGCPFTTFVGAKSHRAGDEAMDISALAQTQSWRQDAAPADAQVPVRPPTVVDLPKLRRALVQLAQGLDALHRAGILHRDIKPSNVLVDRAGRVVILDFGLATDLHLQRRLKGREEFVAGTAEYMAPEQGAGLALGPASDWYSTGVVLYEALTGMRPFRGDIRKVLLDKQEKTPPPPSTLSDGVPADLDDLCVRLLAPEARARPSAHEVLEILSEGSGGSPVPRVTSPATELVGRKEELEVLDRALSDAVAGFSPCVFVRGTSGIGKSALLRSFLEGARDHSTALVLSARCHERESVPYKAVDGVIDGLAKYVTERPLQEMRQLAPADITYVGQIFPAMLDLSQLLSGRTAMRPVDPLEQRRRAFDALRVLIEKIGERRPVVICVDDMQWGDLDGAALLAHILRDPGLPRVLFVVAHRAEDTTVIRLLRKMLRSGAATPGRQREIELGPISRTESQVLAAKALCGDRSATWLGTIADESGGNPFFVQALARASVFASEPKQLSLSSALKVQLEHLKTPARRLLDLVATAGRPISERALFEAFGQRVGARSHLQALRSSHLVRARGAGVGDRIETYHDRVRSAVLALMAPEARALLHGRLAAALEAVGEGDAEVLALHLSEAGQRDKAARYALEAAVGAAQALAFDKAARLYGLSLELQPQLEDSERARRFDRQAEALANAGRGSKAAEAWLAASRYVEAPRAQIELRRRAAEQYLRAGRIDQGLEVLATVLTDVGQPLPETPRGALFSLLSRRMRLRFRGFGFTEKSEAQVGSDNLLEIDSCWSVASGLSTVDNIRGADFQTRHLLLALARGEPYRIARAIATEAAYSGNGGVRSARRSARLLELSDTLARRTGHPHALGLAAATAGIVAFQEGRFKAALSQSRDAQVIFRDRCIGVAWELETAELFEAMSLAHLGEYGALSKRGPKVLASASARGDLYAFTNFSLGYPNLGWLVRDEPTAARSAIQEALGRWSKRRFSAQHFYALLARVHIALYVGAPEQALEEISAVECELDRSLLLRVEFLRVEALWLRARAAAAAAAVHGPGAPAMAIAKRDAARLVRERPLWAKALGHLVRAPVYHIDGRVDAACRELTRAIALLQRANMDGLREAAARRLDRLLGGADLSSRDTGAAREASVKNPAAFDRVLVPGFEKGS